MPTLNSHTHCQAAPANAQPQAWQRVCLLQRSTKTTDKPIDENEARLPNSVYVAIASEVANRIFLVRGVQVMLDNDLAKIYQVETRALNQAIKRNIERFPNDFMFQLTQSEWENLKSHF
ncbi:MAG: ORF6N domain-containing protein, partial [Bacteroidota bacterium]|nr:ORF6N domain-containing protein [Bacteroidota bacterium]